MNQFSSAAQFPSGIRRRLSLTFASFIAIVLVVGGISLGLAVRIHTTNNIVDRENTHIVIIGQIYSIFSEITSKLDQMEDSGQFDRMEHVVSLHEKLGLQLETLRTSHQGEGDEQESALLSDLNNLATELQAFTDRLVMTPISSRHLGLVELERLNLLSQETAGKVVALGNIHRLKITRLLQRSEGMLRAIVILYVAFVFVSGGLIVLASVGFSRGVVVPLRRLSDAALGIVGRQPDERAPSRSMNEIEQLSQAFDVMAYQLQTQERELQASDDQLGQKIRETQALHQISTEISDLRELNRILQSVAEKARELLRGEAAAICLMSSGEEQLVVRATSGPPDAFRSRNHPAPWSVVTGNAMEAHNRYCPAMQPGYLQAHLAAPLRLGSNEIGVICVSGQGAREFTATDTELLTGLARQVVIAIEYARLYEEARNLATLEERDRLARELHDGLAQALGLMHLKLGQIQEQASSAEFSQIADALRETMVITDHAYEDLRQTMFGLRTKGTREMGLILGLTEYLHKFSAQNGIPVELEMAEGRPVYLSPASEVQLIRIIQEALANVRKHAEAGRAWVRFGRQNSSIRVSIEDDGRGFDPTIVTSRDHRAFGLQTMRERAEAIGGRLEIDTEPGRGTRIVVTLPEGA